RDLLSTVNLRQLAQRVTARYHLVPMADEEARGYIKHRLRVAGASHPLFTDGAITQVIKLSKGVPRLINIICDRALLGAYSKDIYQVKASMVKHAAREVGGKTDLSRNSGKWIVSVGILSLVAIIALIGYLNIFDAEFESAAQPPPPVLLAKVEPEPFQVESKSLVLETILSSEAENQGEFETDEGDQELYEVLLVSELKNRLTQTATTDLNEVFFGLFTRWDLEYSLLSGRTGCERATSVRLRCYWGSSTWSNFLALNRPAILWFEGKKARHYMAVLSIIDDYAEVSVGGEDFIIELNDLESIWPDQYLILWRPPALGLGVIRPGDSGELVLWLRRNLDKIDGVKPSSKNAHSFDQNLKKRVKAFQLAHDLEVDGVVGSRTMMYLNVASGDISIPLLNIEQ
ncbi:MAG: hypothetical protein GXP14_13345, partial [Gammaproteobacteria bacterium]|nr:hypothetical protein [Gammaproteobacteria bacterium]